MSTYCKLCHVSFSDKYDWCPLCNETKSMRLMREEEEDNDRHREGYSRDTEEDR